MACFGFADERPANPVARIFIGTANDFPYPWEEGRDEREDVAQIFWTDSNCFVNVVSVMAEHDKVLYALDVEIQPRDFERLCVDLLAREGYRHIEPGGGNKDQGKDAEIRYWRGASDQCSVVAFQFSLEKKWEQKLSRDATKIAKGDSDVGEMVFVTSQKVTGVRKNQLRAEFKSKRRWELTIYDREWFRNVSFVRGGLPARRS